MTLEAANALRKVCRCASDGGGQYTNTGTAAQGKHSKMANGEPGSLDATSALEQLFDECFEQQAGKSELVVADYAILMQQIACDAGEPEFLQL